MRTILSFFLLCAMLLLACCGGEDLAPIDKLPPATHTGANTFGCLVNGEAHLPKGGGLGGPDRGSSYQFAYEDGEYFYHFQVFGANLKNPIKEVYMNVLFQNFEGLKEGGIYTLGDINEHDGQAGYFYYYGGSEIHETNSQHTGILTITHYDYDKRIVSGTFEFEVEAGGELFKITDGRFDMKFTL